MLRASCPRRARAVFAVAAAVLLLCGCGKRPVDPDSSVTRAAVDSFGYAIVRTQPDEFGVVCYASERNGAALSCVKVR